jgi:polysaccharide transporter, PST family
MDTSFATISTSSPVTDHKTLDRSLIDGLAWTGGVKWCGQAISWTISIFVARLLVPADYGLVGMAAIYLGLVSLLSEFGVGTAVVTLRELGHKELAQLHTISLLLGCVGFILSCAAATPLGLFFRESQLPAVVVVTSVSFLFLGFRTVPYALLQKEMRFKLLALFDGLQALGQALATLALALLGFKFWALVIGGLTGAIVSAVLPFVWNPQSCKFPRWRFIEKAISFSRHVCIARLSWYAYDNADFLVVGRVLGGLSLGWYSMAWTVAHLPIEKFTTLVNRVTPPLFAILQDDMASLRRYLRTLTEAVALVTFPLAFGITIVAPEFVHLVLGRKWDGAILPLQLLCAYSSLRSIRILLSPLLTAAGETRFVMHNTLWSLLVLPVAFLIGSHWGVAGVASCWIIAYPILSFPVYRKTFRRIEMRPVEYLQALGPGLSGSLSLVIAVVLLKSIVPSTIPLYLQLATEIATGAAAYGLTMTLLYGDRLRSLYHTIHSLREANA